MMKHINRPLKVTYKHKGRFIRSYVLRRGSSIVGSSKCAHVRIISKEIAGVSCVIEPRGDKFIIMDMGSQPDVRVDGKPFIEHVITEKCSLEIGEHQFDLEPSKIRREIFDGASRDLQKGPSLTIVKWRGQVIETLSKDDVELAVFKNSQNPEIEISDFHVPKMTELGAEKLKLDPDMKKPLIGSILTLLVFLLVFIGLPFGADKKEEKPKDNVYTRMIFDSKVLAQKKKQLRSFGVKTPNGTGNGNGSISEGAKGVSSKATQAVQALRQSGLQATISKIAARASASAKLIASLTAMSSADASMDKKELGAIGGPSVNAATGKTGVIGNGKGFKVGGIGTGGKGGGTGDYKAGAGLGTGAVGNGEVGLEDAESVIEGGLDREVIAGIIREHLGQIRYCYERQLSASPDLYGKIKVRFSINADGEVDTQSIGQTTLNSAMVEECILRRIATWKFPKPKGGTKVLVSYPFLFKSVN